MVQVHKDGILHYHETEEHYQVVVVEETMTERAQSGASSCIGFEDEIWMLYLDLRDIDGRLAVDPSRSDFEF